MPSSLDDRALLRCRQCPRLVSAMSAYRQANPGSHGRPVPGRGSGRSRLLVLGLAPGRRGANHTGLVFAGDASSRFLFQALHHAGLASATDPYTARLDGVRLTNALKCWPPDNRPTPAEFGRCARWLDPELARFWRPGARRTRVIVTLGRLAHQQLQRALSRGYGEPVQALGDFGHHRSQRVHPTLEVLSSYHPSLQNVNTGRLTQSMLNAVFEQAAALSHGKPRRSPG